MRWIVEIMSKLQESIILNINKTTYGLTFEFYDIFTHKRISVYITNLMLEDDEVNNYKLCKHKIDNAINIINKEDEL